MTAYLKTASGWGLILTILALVVALLRSLVAFVGFITMAIQIGLVLAFVALILTIGIFAFRTWSQHKRQREEI